MSKGDPFPADPDDMFSDTRMTFGEHIEDLRSHLFRAIYGFVLGMLVGFLFSKPVLRFIAEPVEDQVQKFYVRYNAKQADRVRIGLEADTYPGARPIVVNLRMEKDKFEDLLRNYIDLPKREAAILPNLIVGIEVVLQSLGVDDVIERRLLQDGSWVDLKMRIHNPIEVANGLQELNQYVRPAGLTTLRVEEGFFVFFKIALLTGLVISSPWVFYQIWAFVAAGLYPNEKRLVNVYLPFSIGLFLFGVFICEFFVIPKAIEAMLWFNEWLGFPPDLRLNEWLGFAIFMPLVFGISFQTPLVMLFMEKIGLFGVENFRNKRRIAWFALAVFAAVITPSMDAFSMLFLWIPMSLLYELGILLCVWSPRDADDIEATTPEGEMVEV